MGRRSHTLGRSGVALRSIWCPLGAPSGACRSMGLCPHGVQTNSQSQSRLSASLVLYCLAFALAVLASPAFALDSPKAIKLATTSTSSSTSTSSTSRSTGWSSLSPSGKALFQQCQQGLKRRKEPTSLPGIHTWTRWELPSLVPSNYSQDLGWVETSGMGLYRAKSHKETCVLVAVKTKEGKLFDQGCLQRASFFANFTSVNGSMSPYINVQVGPIRFSAEVVYLPNLSMHNVCYTAPHKGQYQFNISLMFLNTFHVQTARRPELADGFASHKTAVSTLVAVTGSKYFSLYRHRKSLPPCTLKLLADSKNAGFWIGQTWMPSVCKLRRLSPFSIMQLLNNKNVLFIGDSEIRYIYGLLQFFLSTRSRYAFQSWFQSHPWHRGTKLEHIGLVGHADGPEPPREKGLSMARHTPYVSNTGYSIYYGGRYDGFGHQRVRFRATPRVGQNGTLGKPVNIDFNLTYVTFLDPSNELFSKWMLDGSLTGGDKAVDGRRFDLVLEASLLHGVLNYESRQEYGRVLSTKFVPRMKKLCPPKSCEFMSFGPLVGVEERKLWQFVHMSNNIRNFEFEDEAYRILRANGLPNLLPMKSMTSPIRASELSADPAHYLAPVSLAMMDLVFGSLANTTGSFV